MVVCLDMEYRLLSGKVRSSLRRTLYTLGLSFYLYFAGFIAHYCFSEASLAQVAKRNFAFNGGRRVDSRGLPWGCISGH